jgi:DNA-directed RNA polymerase alpha subunit
LNTAAGVTIGNALRRILLSSLEDLAITSIKVAGIDPRNTLPLKVLLKM